MAWRPAPCCWPSANAGGRAPERKGTTVDFVDQFQRLMKLLFKWALIALASLIMVALIMFGGLYGYEWWTVERHKNKVRVEAKLQEKVCDKEFPVAVIVHNESARTIEETTAYLSARRPGFSTNLTWPGTVSWDAIVKAWRAPRSVLADHAP